MALTYTIDFALPELVEPGFWQFVSTRGLSDGGNPSDSNSAKDIWRDEPTKTLMLMPRQMQPDFLNTAQQVASIIRLSDLNVSATDISNTSIFEQAAFGNNANPYIYHVPVGPSGAFPAAIPGAAPASPPSVVGISTPYNLAPIEGVTQWHQEVYARPPDLTPAPTVTVIGGSGDAKFIGETKTRLVANQGLFIRWSSPPSQIGFPLTYDFLIGQFCLRVKEVMLEVFVDTSPSGDRTSWKKTLRAPLWSVRDHTPQGVGSVVGIVRPESDLAHDRSLLWLPFRRNEVLIQSSAGQTAILTTRARAKRLADDSDWDIVRSDSMAIRVLTNAPGRVQVQKLAYNTGARKVQSPTVTLDYTPGVAPAITITKDSDHATSLTATRSQPPAYTLPVNDSDDCPPKTTDPATDQTRTYGVELTLQASSDGRWTPFFYGFEIAAGRTFGTRPTTPFTISDSSAASYYIQNATLSAGLNPGEGRLSQVKLIEKTPFSFAPYYYRSYYPAQLVSNGTAVFTGWSEPNEVVPWKEGGTRQITLSALDRWKQLTDTFLADQRDWSGFGHIDVVLFVAQQGGVDTTSAETPTGYVPGLLNAINTPLGLGEQTVAQQTRDLKPFWKPNDDDRAASYIQRVAEVFSGWDVGFYPDGQFYYRPRDYYTTSEVTFFSTTAAGSPKFYNANFRTIEPEANVIQTLCGSAKDGTIQRSALWVDWASIRNPNAVNYIGKWRAEVVPLGGTMTCAQLNLAARTIFQQTRRRHLTVEFDAAFAPSLKVGHVCTLGGYGDYRIQSYQVEFQKSQWRKAHYTAEFLEKGYGV